MDTQKINSGKDIKNKGNILFLNDLRSMVVDIRNELSEYYDVLNKNSNYRAYSGLCDVSVDMLKNKLDKYSKDNNINISFNLLHGEQKHFKIKSNLWCLQHTWAVVVFNNIKIYVDPTSSQFKYIHHGIPDFYISTKPPKWFYPDCANPIWKKGLLKNINDSIQISVKIGKDEQSIKIGIIEYLQYDIWGKISDILTKNNF